MKKLLRANASVYVPSPALLAKLEQNKTYCTICLEEIKKDQEKYKLQNCSHSFHKKCISDWSYHKEQCPLCKKSFTQKQCQQLQQEWDMEKKQKKNFRLLMKYLSEEFEDLQKAYEILDTGTISYKDLNTPDSSGNLPVTYAILSADSVLVEKMFETGTNILSRNEDGFNAYDVAEAVFQNSFSEQKRHQLQQRKQLTQKEENYLQKYHEMMKIRTFLGKKWLPIKRLFSRISHRSF